MRARVYDKINDTYYISEVYGWLNFVGDRYTVGRQEQEGLVLYLIDYLDYETQPDCKTNIETIDYNLIPADLPAGYKQGQELTEINSLLEEKHHHQSISCFYGYEFIWEQREKLAELIAKTVMTDKEIPETYNGTCIKALGMRWRVKEYE